MNGREFVEKVFEEVWEPGAKAKHYMKEVFQKNRYTYEETIDMIHKWKEDSKRSPRITTVTNIDLYYDRVTNGMQCIRCKDIFTTNDSALSNHIEQGECWV